MVEDNENHVLVTIMLVLVVVIGMVSVLWAVKQAQKQNAIENWQTQSIAEARLSQDLVIPALNNFTGQLKPMAEAIFANQKELVDRINVLEENSGKTIVVGGQQRTVGECYGVLGTNDTSFDLKCLLRDPVQPVQQ